MAGARPRDAVLMGDRRRGPASITRGGCRPRSATAARPAPADPSPAPGRSTGMCAFAIRPRLRDEPLDARALAHARGVAADWRAAGLAVDLVEHPAPAGRRGGYVLTARSPTRVLRCECRGWRLLGRSAPRGGTPLWSIDVQVGRSVRAAGTAGGGGTPRRTGVAVATAHDLAWRRVLEWIDGGPALPADLDAAVGRAAPRPAARSDRRPVAALLAGALALGALAAYGAWRGAPATNEVGSGPAT